MGWAASAQEAPRLAILRGMLIEVEQNGAAGDFSLRAADQRVWRCRFDANTWFERNLTKAEPAEFRPGDWVEMIGDANGQSCYAATVYWQRAGYRQPKPLPFSISAFLARGMPERLIPRGNLTFTGFVREIAPDRLVLRTRTNAVEAFRLRPDTGFATAGLVVEFSALKINTRVFVRAGRTLNGEIEVYQVVWGDILKP